MRIKTKYSRTPPSNIKIHSQLALRNAIYSIIIIFSYCHFVNNYLQKNKLSVEIKSQKGCYLLFIMADKITVFLSLRLFALWDVHKKSLVSESNATNRNKAYIFAEDPTVIRLTSVHTNWTTYWEIENQTPTDRQKLCNSKFFPIFSPKPTFFKVISETS